MFIYRNATALPVRIFGVVIRECVLERGICCPRCVFRRVVVAKTIVELHKRASGSSVGRAVDCSLANNGHP